MPVSPQSPHIDALVTHLGSSTLHCLFSPTLLTLWTLSWTSPPFRQVTPHSMWALPPYAGPPLCVDDLHILPGFWHHRPARHTGPCSSPAWALHTGGSAPLHGGAVFPSLGLGTQSLLLQGHEMILPCFFFFKIRVILFYLSYLDLLFIWNLFL